MGFCFNVRGFRSEVSKKRYSSFGGMMWFCIKLLCPAPNRRAFLC